MVWGGTDGCSQDSGLRSTFEETQGIGVDRQTATINHAKMGWVQRSWVGQTDGRSQDSGVRSTLKETQGTGEDGQMDTINHVQMGWVQRSRSYNRLGRTYGRTCSRKETKVNTQGDPKDWGGRTDGHHQPRPDGLSSTVKELQQVGWDGQTDTLNRVRLG